MCVLEHTYVYAYILYASLYYIALTTLYNNIRLYCCHIVYSYLPLETYALMILLLLCLYL